MSINTSFLATIAWTNEGDEKKPPVFADNQATLGGPDPGIPAPVDDNYVYN